MVQRPIGIDLAIRGDHVARVFDDALPTGKPLRFRLTSASRPTSPKAQRSPP